MRGHYRRLAGILLLSALLIFGVVGLPPGEHTTDILGDGVRISSDSVLYGGDAVLFKEDGGEFLEYVHDKRQKSQPTATAAAVTERKATRDRIWIKKNGHPNSSPRSSVDRHQASCGPVTLPLCRALNLYPLSQYPNLLGHDGQRESSKALEPYVNLLKEPICGQVLSRFLCMLLEPQCIGTEEPLPPCRPVCLLARDKCTKPMKHVGLTWPHDWSCDRFPTEGLCTDPDSQITPVPEPITKSKRKRHSKKISANHVSRTSASSQSRPPTHKKLQSTSNSGQPLRLRRYDIGQVGQTGLYQGWADVQGQGAANDYCRVIGSSPKSYFLSCTLGGSTSDSHHYVSKRGFDVGHVNTWFMRDMDGDGRDDYCRCVGRGIKSRVSCMKAGQRGFYGSPQQPGSEYTFTIDSTGPCFHRKVNPFIGI